MKSLKVMSARARKYASTGIARATVGVNLALFSAMALATPGAGEFDATSITDKIAEYLGIAVLLATALILGLWTMRLLGLLKPKH